MRGYMQIFFARKSAADYAAYTYSWGLRVHRARKIGHLSAPAAAAKGAESSGNPSRSEQRRADALQYCLGLKSDASASWCAWMAMSDRTVTACARINPREGKSASVWGGVLMLNLAHHDVYLASVVGNCVVCTWMTTSNQDCYRLYTCEPRHGV